MRPSLLNFYFLAQAETPFSSNFLSLISKSEQVAEVTRFSRKTFLGNSDFSPLLRPLLSVPLQPPGERRNDLPRRQTASESLSLQPTHSSWQTDSPHLFQSLLGTPAKDYHPPFPTPLLTDRCANPPWLMLVKTSFIRALSSAPTATVTGRREKERETEA